MHGKRNLNRILNEKSKKPNRSVYKVNSGTIIVGDWTLSEDANGNLVATNNKTGNGVVVAFSEE